MAFQWNKKAAASSGRSKASASSPAATRKSGYHLASTGTAAGTRDDSAAEAGVFSLVDASYSSAPAVSESVQETSYMLDERPPVEGGDSLGKDKVDDEEERAKETVQSASYVPPRRSNVATVRQLRPAAPVDPLPLLDGRDEPSAAAAELDSPGARELFHDTQLFTDDRTESPVSDVVANDADDDFEYDDYMPQLPGSYFTMDPQAYTLTWSKQPHSWLHQPVTSIAATDVDQNNATEEQC